MEAYRTNSISAGPPVKARDLFSPVIAVGYRIQERSTIGGRAFPWETLPLDWETASAASAAMACLPPDPAKLRRVIKVTVEMI